MPLLLDAFYEKETIFGIIIGILCIILIVVWIRTLLQLNKSRFPKEDTRTLWMLGVAFFPLIGILLYWTIGRKQRIQ